MRPASPCSTRVQPRLVPAPVEAGQIVGETVLQAVLHRFREALGIEEPVREFPVRDPMVGPGYPVGPAEVQKGQQFDGEGIEKIGKLEGEVGM